MKKLLILTDFSENASHATSCGLDIAIRLQLNILLYHACPVLQPVPVFDGGLVYETADIMINDARDMLIQQREKLVQELSKRNTGFRPEITIINECTGLAPGVKVLLRKEEIDLIVMGARQGSGLSHFFDGSDTRAVIETASRPVLVVPAKATCLWENIVLASGFHPDDFMALDCLLDWKERSGIKLSIAHVEEFGKRDVAGVVAEIPFREHLNRINDRHQLDYYDVRGKDIGKRLISLCHEQQADILGLVHYRRDLFSRFTGKSKTLQAIKNQQVPLLVFPAVMTGHAQPIHN